MVRKSNLIKLGDAINEIFKQEKLDVKISQFTVKNEWKDIVGDLIANHTSEMFFNNKILFVTISSSALKQELAYSKDELLKNVNKFCGFKLIDQLVVR